MSVNSSKQVKIFWMFYGVYENVNINIQSTFYVSMIICFKVTPETKIPIFP